MYTKLSKKTNTTLINIVLTEKDYHCNIWHVILIGFVKVCPNQYYLNFNAKINVFSTLCYFLLTMKAYIILDCFNLFFH